ncbi:cytidylate kinase-like family protein [Treponema zuelzerae]|uniref:Cytidylate kinase-like family protein n=1 Tax=Teretinema zuelzerae TaxID=156 RepID=A0AAE3JIC4_9SPIR|nr:cytidylate kinase-like family protein [Teretinema zuelzerae]MCD1653996.1 cytidylate kinase-like family protein [Teretinema zuelzerae]
MSVITISREAGSAGTSIARAIAEKTGYRLADKNLIGSILSKYGLIGFERIHDNIPAFWEGFDAQKAEQRAVTIDMMNRTIQALARHGDVIIVGRGGFAVLSGYADVLNVRIQAPLAVRVERIMNADALNAEDAEKLVREKDRVRNKFIETVYGANRETAVAFDLVVDTGKIAPSLACDWIIQALGDMTREIRTGATQAKNIEVDQILADAVAEALKK